MNARTAAATEANIARRLTRHVAELRERGYFVMTPDELARADRDEFGCVVLQFDWPPADSSKRVNVPRLPAASADTQEDIARRLDEIDRALAKLRNGERV